MDKAPVGTAMMQHARTMASRWSSGSSERRCDYTKDHGNLLCAKMAISDDNLSINFEIELACQLWHISAWFRETTKLTDVGVDYLLHAKRN